MLALAILAAGLVGRVEVFLDCKAVPLDYKAVPRDYKAVQQDYKAVPLDCWGCCFWQLLPGTSFSPDGRWIMVSFPLPSGWRFWF